ncbi:MAG TPA: glycosyltransferase family 9 protein [Candidatus Angelobacter sp.]|nr:glycosyltransferase family 9 protein [Candidatus Angelobacter sp.]
MAKILIARLGSMGDILHALPAATAIRAALPDSTLGWLIEERWTELLTARGAKPDPAYVSAQKPVVNLIHTVDTKRWRRRIFRHGTVAELRGARRRVSDIHYDLVLDFQGAIKSAVLGRLSGAAGTAGFEDPREPGARFLYSQRFPRIGDHVIEQNHALAAQALKKLLNGQELKLIPPVLPCDPAAEAWAQSEIVRLGIASFALLNPGAGWGGKQWPTERFGAVAQTLAKHNIKSLVNAPPGEENLASAVVETAGGHAFAVNCSIGQLIALTRRARILIGGDTGPMHLAAALGVPTVALYGPTDPARTGPFSDKAIALRHPQSETTFSHHPTPDAGLLQISADEVIGAARHLLGAVHA